MSVEDKEDEIEESPVFQYVPTVKYLKFVKSYSSKKYKAESYGIIVYFSDIGELGEDKVRFNCYAGEIKNGTMIGFGKEVRYFGFSWTELDLIVFFEGFRSKCK